MLERLRKRAGYKAFDRCTVKVVEFKDFVYEKGGDKEGDDGKKGKTRLTVLTTTPAEDPREFAGNSAVLHCPQTEDPRVNVESQYSSHPDRLDALQSVRELAGELLCRTCPYSQMDRAKVSEERAAFATAEAARLEALAAYNKALEELKQQPQLPPAAEQ